MAATLVVAVAGCSTDNDEPKAKPTSEPSPTQVSEISAIPRPAEAEEAALVGRLDQIAPGLGSEPDDTVDNARNMCSSILGGAKNLTEAAKTRFVGDGVDSMTAAQAKAIIELIRTETWCK